MKKNIFVIAPILFFILASCSGTDGSSASEIIRNTGKISGILGFFLIGLSIFVGSTSRFFDKYFGLEKILRFHKTFTFISFVILLFHPFLINISNILDGTFANIVDYLTVYQYIFGVISFVFFACVVVISYFYFKKINFLLWITFHRITIISYFLAFIHIQFFAVLSLDNAFLKILIYSGLMLAISGALSRIIIMIVKKKRYGKVIENVMETSDVYSIRVKKPENFHFTAGQFCFISFNIKGMRKPHPFTISSSQEDEYLQFTIKSLGKFTSRIKEIKTGEIGKIDGPYGVFTYRGAKSVFIAGGVGITPFISFISSFKDKRADFTLLFGNKTKSDILFKKELDSAQGGKIIHVLSSEKVEGYESGFISKDIIRKYCDLSEDFYLCGPPILVKNSYAILTSLGVKKNRIFNEKQFWS